MTNTSQFARWQDCARHYTERAFKKMQWPCNPNDWQTIADYLATAALAARYHAQAITPTQKEPRADAAVPCLDHD